MSKATLVRVLQPHVELHRDRKTGIAWVEDGRSGCGHSCHPNIDVTGSVPGMKKRFWGEDAVVVRSHGYHYCTSRFSASDYLDQVAAINCRCGGKHVIDFETWLALIAGGYYNGDKAERFKADVLNHYGDSEANRAKLEALLIEHSDLVYNEQDWFEEVIGDFVKVCV